MAISVEGYDQAVQIIPPGRIFATTGWVRISITPRHDIADMRSFGETNSVFLRGHGNGANYFMVYVAAANALGLQFNDGSGLHTTTAGTPGLLVAGVKYIFGVKWDAARMELLVDGVQYVNNPNPVNFAVVPTQLYAGTDAAGARQLGAAFGSP